MHADSAWWFGEYIYACYSTLWLYGACFGCLTQDQFAKLPTVCSPNNPCIHMHQS